MCIRQSVCANACRSVIGMLATHCSCGEHGRIGRPSKTAVTKRESVPVSPLPGSQAPPFRPWIRTSIGSNSLVWPRQDAESGSQPISQLRIILIMLACYVCAFILPPWPDVCHLSRENAQCAQQQHVRLVLLCWRANE